MFRINSQPWAGEGRAPGVVDREKNKTTCAESLHETGLIGLFLQGADERPVVRIRAAGLHCCNSGRAWHAASSTFLPYILEHIIG